MNSKVLILIVSNLLFLNSAKLLGQELERVEVDNNEDLNKVVLGNFTRMFPDIGDAKWYEYSLQYEAVFESHGKINKVLFQADGPWISTKRQMYFKELSADITEIILGEYTQEHILEIFNVKNNKQETYIEFKVREDSKNLLLKLHN